MRSKHVVLCILVNDDLNFARLRNLQSGFDEKRDVLEVADVRFAQDGFRPNLLNLVDDLLRTLGAAFRHVVDDNVRAPFCKKDRNTGTKAARQPLSAK